MKQLTLGLLLILLSACTTTTPTPEDVPNNTPPTTGRIEGSLSYPSSQIPQELKVCAINQADQEEYCTADHLSDAEYLPSGLGYVLEVPVGEYQVYAILPSNLEQRAYFSEFVTCGLKVDCPSHQPITVSVYPGITTPEVNPHDWYAPAEPDGQRPGQGSATVPETICWNRVTQMDETYYWRSGCRGNPNVEICTQALVELTPVELADYRQWVRSGSQTSQECL